MVIAEGSHLFPFRTQKLSPLALMVLHILFVEKDNILQDLVHGIQPLVEGVGLGGVVGMRGRTSGLLF